MLLAKINRRLVKPRVTAVGNDGFGVLLFAFRIPHLARGPNHRRHRRVDDHVAGYVKVGDPFVRVDHR